MHPDDHYDEARMEELQERARDFDWPAPMPGVTHRGLGWARGPQVPPRHTGTTQERGLDAATGILLGVIIGLAIWAVIVAVLTLTL